tara:strand:+ start:269 stop:544 length:276 start_codon:yes stop_codon:yes gene_type:complete
MSKLELPEQPKPAKHWQFVGLSLEGVVLNYNHPDYDDDNMSLHYEMLSDEAKTAFDDLRVVDDSEFGVLFVDLDEYEHKTELLTLIAALEA